MTHLCMNSSANYVETQQYIFIVHTKHEFRPLTLSPAPHLSERKLPFHSLQLLAATTQNHRASRHHTHRGQREPYRARDQLGHRIQRRTGGVKVDQRITGLHQRNTVGLLGEKVANHLPAGVADGFFLLEELVVGIRHGEELRRGGLLDELDNRAIVHEVVRLTTASIKRKNRYWMLILIFEYMYITRGHTFHSPQHESVCTYELVSMRKPLLGTNAV